jgi:hypothetical protein
LDVDDSLGALKPKRQTPVITQQLGVFGGQGVGR